MYQLLMSVLIFSCGILATYYITKWYCEKYSDKLKEEFKWFKSKEYRTMKKGYKI